jgi:hypothetical protein
MSKFVNYFQRTEPSLLRACYALMLYCVLTIFELIGFLYCSLLGQLLFQMSCTLCCSCQGLQSRQNL